MPSLLGIPMSPSGTSQQSLDPGGIPHVRHWLQSQHCPCCRRERPPYVPLIFLPARPPALTLLSLSQPPAWPHRPSTPACSFLVCGLCGFVYGSWLCRFLSDLLLSLPVPLGGPGLPQLKGQVPMGAGSVICVGAETYCRFSGPGRRANPSAVHWP